MVSYHGALINFFIVNEIHLTGSPKLWYQLTLRTIKTGHPKYTFGHFTILIVRMAGKKAKTVRHWCAKVVSHWSSKPARTWDRLAISICNKAIRTLATLAAMQCFREVYDQQLCVDQQCSQLLLSFSFWCSSGCKNSWQVSVPHKQIGFRTLNYLWAYLWVRICVWPPRETPRRRGTAGNRLCPKGGSNRRIHTVLQKPLGTYLSSAAVGAPTSSHLFLHAPTYNIHSSQTQLRYLLHRDHSACVVKKIPPNYRIW